jgi:hypothetical protein
MQPDNEWRGKKKKRTFIVKPVYPVNTRTLVVASQDEEIFGVFDLVREEKTDSLERLFTSVNVVTEEKVVCFWWESAVFKQTQEVIILAVNIAYSLSDELIREIKSRNMTTNRIS